MKKMIIGAAVILVSLSTHLTANAGNNQALNGLIIGAGGGAIAGQAIGRNTEATLIGSAVGGLLGYVIGNEQGKVIHRQTVNYGPPRRVIQQQRIVTYNAPPEPIPRRERHVVYHYVQQQEQRSSCRQAEILGTVNGRAKKLYGTVCRTANGWELVSEPNQATEIGWNDRNNGYRRHNPRF